MGGLYVQCYGDYHMEKKERKKGIEKKKQVMLMFS